MALKSKKNRPSEQPLDYNFNSGDGPNKTLLAHAFS